MSCFVLLLREKERERERDLRIFISSGESREGRRQRSNSDDFI